MNTLYYGDNLHILRDHIPAESVDLVYLDPPFNSNRSYNVLFKESGAATKRRPAEAASSSEAQIAAFDDTWHWGPSAEAALRDLQLRGENEQVIKVIEALVEVLGRQNDMTAYLVMMAVRLVDSEASSVTDNRAPYSEFALSGLLTCLRCGHSMHGYTSSKYKLVKGEKRTYRYRTYRCTGRANSSSCHAPMIQAVHLEGLVIDAVCRHIRNNESGRLEMYNQSVELLANYRQRLAEAIQEHEEQIADKKRARSDMVQAISRAVGKVSDAVIEQMDVQVLAWSAEIRQHEAQREFARAELGKLGSVRLRLDALLASMDATAARLREAELSVQRRLLKGLVSGIEIDPDARRARVYLKQFLLDDAAQELEPLTRLFVQPPLTGAHQPLLSRTALELAY